MKARWMDLGAIASLILAAACPGPQVARTPTLRECPTHHTDGRDSLRIPLVDSPGNEGRSGIPEFHDCQRLVEKAGTYGPLAAIFSIASSDTLPQAIENVPVAVVMAIVMNVDGGDYHPLHISGLPGDQFCLYVNVQDNGAVRAWMEPMGRDGCARNVRRVTEFDPAEALHGRVVQSQFAHDPTDYPAVARWDDAMNGQTGIVFACVALGYCEVFPSGSGALVATRVPARPGHPRDVVSTVKPWYDQQRLAESSTDKNGRPGPGIGVLVPHDSLGHWAVADFRPSGSNPQWRVVAWEFMNVQVNKYAANLNWPRTGLGHPDELKGNEIALCTGSRADCGVPDSATLDCSRWHQRPEDSWFARITNPDGEVMFRCVDRESHAGLNFKIPGVVRFRWAVDDEKAWIRCGLGCCSIEP